VTLTPLALAVLNLLQEHPAHPYELQQTIANRRMDTFIKVRAGSLYHTVERLHRLGLVRPVETNRTGRRPERTVYALTDDGRDQFRDELRATLRIPGPEYPVFGSAVEMLRALDPMEVVDLLEHRAIAVEAAIAAFDQATAGLTKRGHPRIDLVEVEYATTMLRAELGWVLTLVDEIRSGVLHWSVAETASSRPRDDDPAEPAPQDQCPGIHPADADHQTPEADHTAPERPTP
jgi:DNA-binding PadR family transcriptional regulator